MSKLEDGRGGKQARLVNGHVRSVYWRSAPLSAGSALAPPPRAALWFGVTISDSCPFRLVVSLGRLNAPGGSGRWLCWPTARVRCSSTANSREALRAPSRLPIRPPRRCSVSRRTLMRTTWAAPSKRRAARSTTPTGRATPSCGCGASGSCAKRCRSTPKSYASSPSRRWVRRGCSPRWPSSRVRSTTWRSRRTPPKAMSGTRIWARRRRWAFLPGAPSPARRSVSSGPSRRGTSRTRSIWPSWVRPWRRATPSCSNPRPTLPGALRCWASSWPSTRIFRPAWSTSSRPAITASAPCSPKTLGWT